MTPSQSNVSTGRDPAERLAAGFGGALIGPDDEPYETTRRIWNGTVDRRPALIARCATATDVAAAVRLATSEGLPVSVCGGGHGVAGTAVSDGGLMIDLRDMRQVTVDADRRLVRAGGGATLADLDEATAPHGLAVPVGVASETGIAGLALGGGLGHLRRTYGLTCDNLVSATVVTAAGEIVAASEHDHPDLFWALRGGGGNFGIVTEFEFRAHPVPAEVPTCVVFHRIESAAEGLRLVREVSATAPDELNLLAILWSVPEGDPFPTESHGLATLVFVAAWLGRPEDAERAFEPFRTFAEPIADLSRPMPFLDFQKWFDADYPQGGRYYWKSLFLPDLHDEAIDTLLRHAVARPAPHSSIDVWQLGGAISRVPPEATAYAHRKAPYLIGIEANWHEPGDDEAAIGWAREVYGDLQRFSEDGGLYVNFPGSGEEGDDLVRRIYGPNHERLARIKARYDPENRLRLNQNIRPAG